MSKMKTKSGAKKRFKITAKGKIKTHQVGKRHRLINNSPARTRDLRGGVHVQRAGLLDPAPPGQAAPVLVRVGTRKVLLRAGEQHEFRRADSAPN